MFPCYPRRLAGTSLGEARFARPHTTMAWRQAREAYHRIRVPVLLVYGDRDWSREAERQANLLEIPGARLAMVPEGGYLLSLDRPEAVVEHIRAFVRQLPALIPSR